MLQQIAKFLTPGQGQLIIEKYKSSFSPVSYYGDQNNRYRTADQVKLDTEDAMIRDITRAIAALTNIPAEHQEFPVLVRYLQGGEYKKHYDFFNPAKEYAEKELAKGGQRSKTALIYLNDDFKGGCTHFPVIKKMVRPENGKLVLWDNTHPDGSPDIDSLHAGLPVKEGIKYIFITWIRERPFGMQ